MSSYQFGNQKKIRSYARFLIRCETIWHPKKTISGAYWYDILIFCSAVLLVKLTSGSLMKRSTESSYFNRRSCRLCLNDFATRPRSPFRRRGISGSYLPPYVRMALYLFRYLRHSALLSIPVSLWLTAWQISRSNLCIKRAQRYPLESMTKARSRRRCDPHT